MPATWRRNPATALARITRIRSMFDNYLAAGVAPKLLVILALAGTGR